MTCPNCNTKTSKAKANAKDNKHGGFDYFCPACGYKLEYAEKKEKLRLQRYAEMW